MGTINKDLPVSKDHFDLLQSEEKKHIIMPIHLFEFEVGEPFKISCDETGESMVVVVTYKEQASPAVYSFVYSIKILIRSIKL